MAMKAAKTAPMISIDSERVTSLFLFIWPSPSLLQRDFQIRMSVRAYVRGAANNRLLTRAENKKLAKILHRIYDEPYVSGMGSHLHVVAAKK